MSKRATLMFITVLAVSSLIMVEPVFAQSIPKPAVPEFTLKYVDNTIQAEIRNNIGASYYNFRYKGRYENENEWRYHPFSPSALGYMLPDAFSVPYQASTSDYTVAALPSYFFKDITVGGEVDVQVQALFGDFRAEPYVHITPVGGPTYDFYFEGTASDWSNTQTIKIGETQSATPSPSTTPISTPYQEPQQTEQEIIIGAAIAAVVIGAGLGLLIYLIKRK
jgi:hypothetical protein